MAAISREIAASKLLYYHNLVYQDELKYCKEANRLIISLFFFKNHIFLRSFRPIHHIFLRSFRSIYHIFLRSLSQKRHFLPL